MSDNNLGGIMFWSIDNDDFRGQCNGRQYPLIESAKAALFGIDLPEISKPDESSAEEESPRSTTPRYSFFFHSSPYFHFSRVLLSDTAPPSSDRRPRAERRTPALKVKRAISGRPQQRARGISTLSPLRLLLRLPNRSSVTSLIISMEGHR